jgi:hypothetical protein
MKRLLLFCILGLATTASSYSASTSLWDELFKTTVTHVNHEGPDTDTAQFIATAGDEAWRHRTEMVKAVGHFLTNESPDKVASALQVFYRFRAYRPGGNGPGGPGDFEAANAAFFADLDKQVYPRFDYFRQFKSDPVDRALALYLGVSRTPQAKRELLQIARIPSGVGVKEQALICLAWHRDPADMDTLLLFMLEDSPVARSLPYHFRISYGKAAIPSLLKAVQEAKSGVARQEAALQLIFLDVPEGFDYLRDSVLKDPHAFDRIRQWAFDYLGLPHGEVSKEDVARQIDRKKETLPKSKS